MKPLHRLQARPRQRGIVLYVALIVMVGMMLAGVAVLRSVGSGVAVAGNLAFKQNATLAADRGAEQAVAWLLTKATADLLVDDAAHGYFATWVNTFDAASFNWSAAAVQQATADDGVGNRVRYVIHRLCSITGTSQAGAKNAAGEEQQCAVHGKIVHDPTTGKPIGAPPRPLFRVTTRVDGPRNTLSYVQVVVY
jgi:Tfp pilus assembly protein PilX